MFRVESEMKKNQNKLCYFFCLFSPKFLHFCRMTHIQKPVAHDAAHLFLNSSPETEEADLFCFVLFSHFSFHLSLSSLIILK